VVGRFQKKGCLVKSFYNVMGCMMVSVSLERVWRTKVPLRVAFFVWSVALGKILNMENLWK